MQGEKETKIKKNQVIPLRIMCDKRKYFIIAYLYAFTREEIFPMMMIQHNSAQSTSVTCSTAVTPERGYALSNIHNFWAEQIKASRMQ